MHSQKNKWSKKITFYAFLPTLLIFLSGCMRIDQETGEPVGWMSNFIYNFLVTPMFVALDWFANLVGSYAIALIILTLIIRLVIMPLMLNSQASMIESQAKMNHVKPLTDKIQELAKQTDDPQAQQTLQLKQMEIFKKYNISLGSQLGGCLPLLIQMPFFVAIFHVINHSPEIASETFLGIHLGERSVILSILVGIVYYLQSKLMTPATTTDISDQQQQMTNSMTIMNPLMFFIISITSPAGVALYWLVGGVFGIVQQFITTRYFRPRIEARAERKLGDKPDPSELDQLLKKAKRSIAETKNTQRQVKNKNRKRNAGKQNHRK